jgi:hypothetical protein
MNRNTDQEMNDAEMVNAHREQKFAVGNRLHRTRGHHRDNNVTITENEICEIPGNRE